MKTKLATSGSKFVMKDIISKFYASNLENIELRDDGSIFNKKLNKKMSTWWCKSRGRYIFWMEKTEAKT